MFFESALFYMAFGGYLAGMALYWIPVFSRRDSSTVPAGRVVLAALLCHLVSLVLRFAVGRQMPDHQWYMPWCNWYEAFSFFAFLIAAVFAFLQIRVRLPVLGLFVMTLAVAFLAASVGYPALSGDGVTMIRRIPSLPAALNSAWMLFHGPVIFLSYALFANAFGVAVAYIVQERSMKDKSFDDFSFHLPSLEELDGLVFRLISLAFPLLTLGMILGAQWAFQAWGRYWGWDAKETWSLITWAVYLVYLHMRLVNGWTGGRSIYLSVAGFGAVMVTSIGVNSFSAVHGFLFGG